MKSLGFVIVLCCVASWGGRAQELKEIKLKAPDKNRGVSVMKALELRQSQREFAPRALSREDLSDLLWAANGINRPESGKRTAPSAMNKQDIDIYVCLPEGAYLYEAKDHVLKPVTAGDLRMAVAGAQPQVAEAPVALVLVSDIAKFNGDKTHRMLMGAMDAGIVSQNIAVFCAGTGLVTVPRMSMDQAKLRKALKLRPEQELMLNNPVGYPKP